MSQNCCVPNCYNRNDTKKCYNIPRTTSIQQEWLQRISRPDLKCSNFLQNYLVCEDHFSQDCFTPKKTLLDYSLPTLKLPEYCPDKNSEALIPKMSAEKEELSDIQSSSSILKIADTEAAPSSNLETIESSDSPRENEPSESKKLNESKSPRQSCSKKVRNKTMSKTEILRGLKSLIVLEKSFRSKNYQLRDKIYVLGKTNTRFLSRVSRTTFNLFMSQQPNQKVKRKDQKFSIDDKIFSLALYKQGVKGYSYLSKIFSLPSKRTLVKLLSHIPFQCGINHQIFENLTASVGELGFYDRHCVLMFDEVALCPGLSYNFSRDSMEGLVDFGGIYRRAELADHALVLMIKSISGKWKQPVAFYFCQNSTPTIHLIRIIKDVVRQIRQTGLYIVATICDHSSTNVAVINKLLNETSEYCLKNGFENRYQGYLIDGQEIVHLYDPPHLLKGIRNALLSKDLYFCQEGIQKVASWSHIVALYQLRKDRLVPKLTDEHVLPCRINKKKVQCAAQVFSRSVGVALKFLPGFLSRIPDSTDCMDPSATQTGDAILFFDDLFDSVNGNYVNAVANKPLANEVKKNSPHIDFWKKSLPILDSMYFKTSPFSDSIITPSLKHFKFTIRGFLYIWRILKKNYFDSFSARNFNLDPLDNVFSQIKNPVNPTCSSFISSLKFLVINNFQSPNLMNSPDSNCEKDSNNALDTFKIFIQKKNALQLSPTVEPPVYTVHQNNFDIDRDFATPYVARYLARKFMKKINNCPRCFKILQAYAGIPANALSKGRTFHKAKMIFQSRTFTSIFHDFSCQVLKTIPLKINMYDLKEEVIADIDIGNIELLFCSTHKQIVPKEYIDFGLKFILLFYVGTVNKILSGKKSLQGFSDPILKMASEKYQKRKK